MPKSLLKNSPQTLKTELHNFLNNVPVTKRLNENIVFQDLTPIPVMAKQFYVYILANTRNGTVVYGYDLKFSPEDMAT
jgi:hypothetical protein